MTTVSAAHEPDKFSPQHPESHLSPSRTMSPHVLSSRDFISQVPLELKSHILKLLPDEYVPSLRLTARAWADAGAEYMFKDGFTIRPHLADMRRLEEVSKSPHIAKGIKTIVIFMGDMRAMDFMKSLGKEESKIHNFSVSLEHAHDAIYGLGSWRS